jgi:argininosuccinate synthase
MTAAALMPESRMIAPWRLPEFYAQIKGREEAITFAREHNIPIKATNSKPWSIDENMLHISYESGVLEDPAVIAPP